ncbi:response regulator [Coleofasciculus sp. LEGE 07092]|uniref:hybrid sensor histidine kinase/response regulator n=1 Tax=Coleofasciculus sp. LEGE 07092 TaxID=2777969 RepID=UPI00188206B0|nr:response regulator [Coleofasciculus sp. LEGE 07092]MBE9148237.1 response regulator [Coleofasciculus sp. LEGE 07092]
MQPEQQQRIMGYFIEEAKDHLNTIEQGLLSLQSTMQDTEMANELFRAAHSVKGGAAMLGLESIQQTAHRLEDYFKILKDSPVQTDQQLESLFLRVFDTLQSLLDQLQGPFGLTDDTAKTIMSNAEPIFEQLSRHLNQLVHKDGGTTTATVREANVAGRQSSESSANPLPVTFKRDVLVELREMLQLFKQSDSPQHRAALQNHCDRLLSLGKEWDLAGWGELLETAKAAIANPQNSYRLLASVTIKEIKQAQELVLLGRSVEIAPSEQLESLAPALADIDAAPAPNPYEQAPSTDTNTVSETDRTSSNVSSKGDRLNISDNYVNDKETYIIHDFYGEDTFIQPETTHVQENSSSEPNQGFDQLSNPFAPPSPLSDQNDPEVGLVELNTLADIFEGQTPELDQTWQEEEIISLDDDPFSDTSDDLFNLDNSSDFSDLLSDAENRDFFQAETSASDGLSESQANLNDEFSDLLFESDISDSSVNSSSSTADLSTLLDDSFLEEDEETTPPGNDRDLDFSASSLDFSNQNDDLVDLDSAATDAWDLSNPFEEMSFDSEELDLESLEQSELDADFESLDNFFDTDSVTLDDSDSSAIISPRNSEDSSILEMPGLTDELEANQEETLEEQLDDSETLAEPVSDLSEPLFNEDALEIPPVAAEDLEALFIEETEESQAPSEFNLESDWLTEESDSSEWDLETNDFQTEPDETSDLFESWESEATAPEAVEDLEGLADFFTEETSEPQPSSELDLETDWDFNSQPSTEPDETSDLFESWESEATAPEAVEDLEDFFTEEASEPQLSSELDLETDWDFNSQPSTEPDETSDLFESWESEATAPEAVEDLEDFFTEEASEPQLSSELDLEADWDFDSQPSTEPDETSDLFESWESEATAPEAVEDLEDFFSSEGVTAEGDFSLEINEETDWALDIDLESSDEFEDLEAMLASETPTLPAEFDSIDEFEDLEAMLELDTPGAPVAFGAVDNDAFEDLEALLSEQMPPKAANQEKKAGVQNKDTLDEDLEKLLEQADKTMPGSPTSSTDSRQTRILPARRIKVFEQTMRVPVKHLDSLSNLVGELVVSRNSLEQDQERLRQFLDNLQHQVSALSDVGARMRDLYERSLLEASLLASRHNSPPPLFSSDSSSHSSDSAGAEYHPLEMDRFTGFHLLSQEMIELIVQVRESASDVEFLVDETDQVARNLRQVTTQLQEGLTRSRMVPFAQTADRLPRAVREISMKLGKEAELQVEGRETLIDKMILEHLYDPMTHLVNNAITHGIETPEERRAAGKPPVGQVTLRAFHQGNQTVISISDDGAGIDPERVRSKAVEKKLISRSEAKNLTPTDLYDFLFHPGFSTKDQAGEFAGRGVGMDVVRTSLSEIRGAIYIDSVLGKGTTFTIRLPLTLSICKALCCLSDRSRIAFPMDGVEDMMPDIGRERIQTNSDNQTYIQWRDSLLLFQPLSDLLTYNRQLNRGTVYGGKREDDTISIVVLRSAGNFLAIQVDQIIGEQEIVIKQLEGPPPKPVGIAGATVLGDGRIMSIADVLELIDLASGRLRKDSITIWSREEPDGEVPQEPPVTKHEPMVLIVDDSITVRELLSMTFAKAGYRVEQARDGQEAWEKLRSGLPCDIVFCDIEMPRMDGLELLSRLQKDEDLRKLPIAMLTSRGAKRHRQMASQLGASGYFTKPYLEEVLLDAAQRMIQGEVLFSSSEA